MPVIQNNMAQIFAEADITMDPNYASCIAGALQFFGAYVSIALVERLGRKVNVRFPKKFIVFLINSIRSVAVFDHRVVVWHWSVSHSDGSA